MHPKQLLVNVVILVGVSGPAGISGSLHILKKCLQVRLLIVMFVFIQHLVSTSCVPGPLGIQT